MGLLDKAYGALKQEHGPLGLRAGDFIPYVSGLLAADDAQSAIRQGNYGEAAGALAGFIPAGRVVKKLTGVDLSSMSPRQIFAGKNAKNADLEALKRAETRLAAGDNPKQVWSDEGWFKGPDGKMRWEIDDSKAGAFSRGSGLLDVSTHHKDLEAEYPKLIPRSLQMDIGDADAAVGELAGGEKVLVYSNKKPIGRETVVHELQHLVQQREGFATGGSPAEFTQQAKALRMREPLNWRQSLEKKTANGLSLEDADIALAKEYADAGLHELIPDRMARDIALSPSFSGKLRADAEQLVKEYGLTKRTQPYQPHEMYQRLAGESEARLAETRMGLSPEQRRATYPQYEYEDELIFRGLLNP